MAEFRGGGKEVEARILYWGVEGAGKLTNLRVIHSKLRTDHRGKLRQIPTRLDPTVTYAILPIELGQIGGVRTRIQIVAVPGGDEHALTRKQLLDRADGIVFVVDTSRDRIDENLASFDELRSALAAYGRVLEHVPLVIQYNKSDQADPFALEELHRKLSLRGVAAFEAAATEGTAVLQTLTTISKRVIRQLREQEAAAERPAPAPREQTRPAPDATQILDPARPGGGSGVAGGGVDPSLLSADAAPESEAIAATTAEAQSLFEPSFQEVTARVAHAHPHGTPEAGGSVRIASVGQATPLGPRSLRVPLVLRDDEGRELSLSLTIQLDRASEGSSD